MSHWAETPGQTEDQMEGLHLPDGLGTPRDPDKWSKMDERMDGFLGSFVDWQLLNCPQFTQKLHISEDEPT